MAKCEICGQETAKENCAILFEPSNVFVKFCDYHMMRVLSQKPSGMNIRDWLKLEKKQREN